ncbi:MAG: hypothetical protein LUC41_02945 [Clostridiales bacterium]|nr:hypothetical protein [Clostridiales bacterium]
MSEGRAQVTLGLSVVAITKYLMEYYSIDYEEAYKRLIATDFFEKINDLDTGLLLEPDKYLCEACLLELEHGSDAMYEYISQ